MTHRVTHTTTYVYSRPVALSHNLVHLLPRSHPRQECLSSELLIQPVPAVSTSFLDYFGNHTTFFTVQERHQELTVQAVSEARVASAEVPEPRDTPPWDAVAAQLSGDRNAASLEALQFAFDSAYIQAGPQLAGYAEPTFPPGRPLLEALLELTARIHADFRYDPSATTVTTHLDEVLHARRGVCQDFAQLQIGCLRSLGLAARYVSGYLVTHPLPGQPRLEGADASHAWLSVWCPGFGWIDLDPTNNLIPSQSHITLAWGRDYDDVSPIKGVVLGGSRHTIRVGVDVRCVENGA